MTPQRGAGVGHPGGVGYTYMYKYTEVVFRLLYFCVYSPFMYKQTCVIAITKCYKVLQH